MTVYTLEIAANDDDVQMTGVAEGKGPTGNGAMSMADAQAEPGNHGIGANQAEVCGWRWQVPIDQGTSISQALLRVKCAIDYNSSPNQIRLRVSGQDSNTASAFANTAGNINGTNRARTTADVLWNADNLTANTWYEIDVTAIVQAILNRAGWANNNFIALFMDVDTTTTDDAEWQDLYCRETSVNDSAELVITTSVTPESRPPFKVRLSTLRSNNVLRGAGSGSVVTAQILLQAIAEVLPGGIKIAQATISISAEGSTMLVSQKVAISQALMEANASLLENGQRLAIGTTLLNAEASLQTTPQKIVLGVCTAVAEGALAPVSSKIANVSLEVMGKGEISPSSSTIAIANIKFDAEGGVLPFSRRIAVAQSEMQAVIEVMPSAVKIGQGAAQLAGEAGLSFTARAIINSILQVVASAELLATPQFNQYVNASLQLSAEVGMRNAVQAVLIGAVGFTGEAFVGMVSQLVRQANAVLSADGSVRFAASRVVNGTTILVANGEIFALAETPVGPVFIPIGLVTPNEPKGFTLYNGPIASIILGNAPLATTVSTAAASTESSTSPVSVVEVEDAVTGLIQSLTPVATITSSAPEGSIE